TRRHRRFRRAIDGHQGRGAIRLHHREGRVRERRTPGRLGGSTPASFGFLWPRHGEDNFFLPVFRHLANLAFEQPTVVFWRLCLRCNSILGQTGYIGRTDQGSPSGPANEFSTRSVRTRQMIEGLKMKKLLLALFALAALNGSAIAADLAAKPYVKAPPPAPAPSWTGFYIFGGGGGGLWGAGQHIVDTVSGPPLTVDQRPGGSGWFGTVGLGYDWQFNSNWVAGVFGDGQFGSIKGTFQDPVFSTLGLGTGFNGISGTQKLEDSWAVGVRLGYLVAPNVLSYVNG